MVAGVPDNVGEGILDGFEQGLVELSLGPDELEMDLLFEVLREVAHDARELVQHVADGLHARLHHLGLDLGRDEVQPLADAEEPEVARLVRELKHLVPDEHELAHQGHEIVQEEDRDADR